MNTTCEHCVFAKRQDGTQIGCELNRLDKFKSFNQAKLGDNGYYEINNFCNACRNVYWHEHDYNKPMDDLVQAVKQEIKPKFAVFLSIDNVTTKQFDTFYNRMKKGVFFPQIHKFVLFGLLDDKNIDMVQSLSLKHDNIVGSLDISTDKFSQTAKYVHRCMANYIVFADIKSKVNINLERYNLALNVNLEPIMYEDGSDYFCVSTFFYKRHIYCDNPVHTIKTEYNEYGKSKS